jgi:hypothetical protein
MIKLCLFSVFSDLAHNLLNEWLQILHILVVLVVESQLPCLIYLVLLLIILHHLPKLLQFQHLLLLLHRLLFHDLHLFRTQKDILSGSHLAEVELLILLFEELFMDVDGREIHVFLIVRELELLESLGS